MAWWLLLRESERDFLLAGAEGSTDMTGHVSSGLEAGRHVIRKG